MEEVMQHSWGRTGLVALFVSGLVSLGFLFTGCQTALDATELKPLVTVTPKTKTPFTSKVVSGVDCLVSRDPIGKFGGTFYDAEIGEGPKTFNPWAAFDATSSTLGSLMMPGLVETDAYTGESYPYLAKTVTIHPDNKTYTVVLRKGLTWSDGKPITAKDVVFTWNVILKQGLGNPSTRDIISAAGGFPKVEAPDDLTIRFQTAEPFAPFVRNLSTSIAPAHIFEPIVKKGGDAAFSAAWGVRDALEHPESFVVSGAWQLEKYELSERVMFKRNPHYFVINAQGKKLPYLERYVLRFVKDQNNLQLQYQQGGIDNYGVAARYVGHVRRLKSPEVTLYDMGPTTSSTFITFNLNTRKDAKTGKMIVDPIKSKWFNTVQFRQAIDWAINREAMVQNILLGVGAPWFLPEAAASIYLHPKLAKGHPQDLNKARALLKAGGFHWDANKQLRDAQNHLVEFTLYTNTGNDQREATGVGIQQDLAELGIKVLFKPMEFNVLVGKMNAGDWEAMIMGLTGSTLEPHGGFNVWKSDGALHLFNQRPANTPVTDQLPWETEMDTLFTKGAQILDTEKRKPVYWRYQEITAEQQPMIYLYSPQRIMAVKTRLQNVDPTPLDLFHNLHSIWIKE